MAPLDTNLLLVLDISGSMITTDGVNGTSRLATAINALNQLLDSYDSFGEVRVQPGHLQRQRRNHRAGQYLDYRP